MPSKGSAAFNRQSGKVSPHNDLTMSFIKKLSNRLGPVSSGALAWRVFCRHNNHHRCHADRVFLICFCIPSLPFHRCICTVVVYFGCSQRHKTAAEPAHSVSQESALAASRQPFLIDMVRSLYILIHIFQIILKDLFIVPVGQSCLQARNTDFPSYFHLNLSSL